MNGTIIAGSVLLIATIAFSVVGYYLLTEEQRKVTTAQPVAANAMEGAWVIVEGRISESMPTLIQEFVHADRERYSEGTGSTSASWRTEERFYQPLQVEVAGMAAPVVVRSEVACSRGGDVKVVPLAGKERTRLIGLYRGATITAVGKVVSTHPPVVHAELIYAAPKASYQADLRKGYSALYVVVGLMMLVSVAIIAKGIWRP